MVEPLDPRPAAAGAPVEEGTEKSADSGDRLEKSAAEAPQLAAADEIGGPKGPEPTRFGDWERKGRCIDF